MFFMVTGLSIRQLKERVNSVVDDTLPVMVLINNDDPIEVDSAYYSLAYDSFVINISLDEE